jgi:methylenetetrahydrofolate dehydrogenase (NADP+) / methenyltetrahydrofolate cyclohydrolase
VVGIQSANYRLPYDASKTILLTLIRLLNEDTSIHGILVQLPLPPHIDASKVLDAIDPN